MKTYIKLIIVTIFGLTHSACGGNASISIDETASAQEATAIAEVVTSMRAATTSVDQLPTETPAVTAALTSDYENAAPVLMQVVIGIYQLEGTDQAVTAAQAQELMTLLTTLKDISADNTTTQEQIDALVTQAMALLTAEQIQAIAAMQITQETAMATMQGLGISIGGPGQGDGNAPAGDIGQPPQGDMPGGAPPEGGPGGQPSAGGQMGMPPADGMQRGTGFIPQELLDAIIEFLQTKITS